MKVMTQTLDDTGALFVSSTADEHGYRQFQTKEHDDQLRAWARGVLALEAATELLIRARQTELGRPWIQRDQFLGNLIIDFEGIPELLQDESDRAAQILMVASSIAGFAEVTIADAVTGLDHEMVGLILAAIAHAAGFSESSNTLEDLEGGGVLRLVRQDAVHAWPVVDESEDADFYRAEEGG